MVCPVPPFSQGFICFLQSFPDIWEAESQIHAPVPFTSWDDSRSLNVQIPHLLPHANCSNSQRYNQLTISVPAACQTDPIFFIFFLPEPWNAVFKRFIFVCFHERKVRITT